MKRARFESVAKKSGFIPIGKRPSLHGDVLLAEKYRNYDPEFDGPHYQMVWALDREAVDAFQILYFKFGKANQKQRIAACLSAAEEYIKDNLEVGRFH